MVLCILAVWLIVAIAASVTGILQLLPPPFPQLLLVLLTLLCALAMHRIGALRSALKALDIRYLIGVHLTRFVGFYFLVLFEQGLLPYDFAVLGGWGDIVVAAAAFVLIGWITVRGSIARGPVLVWNALGLADILFVVFTAGKNALTIPGSMMQLTVLPLSLLILFLVPIIIAVHLFIFTSRREARYGAQS